MNKIKMIAAMFIAGILLTFVSCGDNGKSKKISIAYNSRSYGSKLFYANARLVSTASADGGIMCGNRCRNHSRNAEKAADAAFIGGDHRSADGRDGSLDSDEWKNSLKPHCALNFLCIVRKTML